jgi:hypothetical protein
MDMDVALFHLLNKYLKHGGKLKSDRKTAKMSDLSGFYDI